MPSDEKKDEKMEVLEDAFLKCDAAKNEAISEIQDLNKVFRSIVDQVEGTDTKSLENVLSKLKSFLSSTLNTISSIQNNIESTTSTCSQINKDFSEMGAK